MIKTWENEPDVQIWLMGRMGCVMRRNMETGTWCGYVGVQKDHPWFKKDYGETVPTSTIVGNWKDRAIDLDKTSILSLFKIAMADGKDGEESIDTLIQVHGGLTYSGWLTKKNKNILWYFGFDCAHYGDFMPGLCHNPSYLSFGDTGVYRDQQYVHAEVVSLAEQLKAVQG
jgi:hypothetical protein